MIEKNIDNMTSGVYNSYRSEKGGVKVRYWKIEEEKLLKNLPESIKGFKVEDIEKSYKELEELELEELELLQERARRVLVLLLNNNTDKVLLLESETWKIVSHIAYYDKLYDQTGAAEYLGISRQGISYLVKEKKLDYVFAGIPPKKTESSKRKFFYKSMLDRYLLAKKIVSIN